MSGSVQHVSSKIKGIVPEQQGVNYDRGTGYSNRQQKVVGGGYHASSLSFSKNAKLNQL